MRTLTPMVLQEADCTVRLDETSTRSPATSCGSRRSSLAHRWRRFPAVAPQRSLWLDVEVAQARTLTARDCPCRWHARCEVLRRRAECAVRRLVLSLGRFRPEWFFRCRRNPMAQQPARADYPSSPFAHARGLGFAAARLGRD